MNKKVYHFYSLFLEKQEQFLNRMADEGWRLVKTNRLSYEFAPVHRENTSIKLYSSAKSPIGQIRITARFLRIWDIVFFPKMPT